ncbi:MAG: phosphoribosylglycinamide formyltransferase [Gammaproteobacteria bacterium]|nr:phosphoribosylglycinamide formyltransferase [Gammaproteobacteria bacterium]
MSRSDDDRDCVNIVVLISGNGSNLQAIIDDAAAQDCPYKVCAVVCNSPIAYGLKRANNSGITTRIIDHRDYPTRRQFDQALMSTIDQFAPALIALAGFMRIVGPEFIEHYEGRIMNIHPSLLPQFPGLNTHERALADGAREHGATVHFVTTELDAGPVVIQSSVPVLQDDTPETLAARVLEQEHRIYPRAIRWYAEGRLSLHRGKVLVDGAINGAHPVTTS